MAAPEADKKKRRYFPGNGAFFILVSLAWIGERSAAAKGGVRHTMREFSACDFVVQ